MKRIWSNLALLVGVTVIVAPVAVSEPVNPYVLTAAKIITALGYTPANGSLYCALTGCTMSGDIKFTSDTTIGRGSSAANIRQGGPDAASPVAQISSVQSVLAGTTNTAGPDRIYTGSQSTGNAGGGGHIFQVGASGSSGTSQNVLFQGLKINNSGNVGISGNGSGNIKLRITGATGAITNHGLLIEDSGGNTNLDVFDNGTLVLGRGSVATNSTGGYPYITGGAGPPTGTPTTIGSYVPMYVDTTNSQLYLYISGAWKQPKTPAGAATVTFQ